MGVTNLDQIQVTTPITAANLSSNALATSRSHLMATIATTGSQEILFVAPCAGTLAGAALAAKDALAASDTNFLTFTVTNKSNSNAVMLAATGQTTQVTGGAALAAYGRRVLALSATPANLVVALGDVITFQTSATGTLANTVTEPVAILTFTPS
jgi:hypothetical protein